MDFEFGQRCLQRGETVVYEPRLRVTAPIDPAMLSRRYFRQTTAVNWVRGAVA